MNLKSVQGWEGTAHLYLCWDVSNTWGRQSWEPTGHLHLLSWRLRASPRGRHGLLRVIKVLQDGQGLLENKVEAAGHLLTRLRSCGSIIPATWVQVSSKVSSDSRGEKLNPYVPMGGVSADLWPSLIHHTYALD